MMMNRSTPPTPVNQPVPAGLTNELRELPYMILYYRRLPVATFPVIVYSVLQKPS